MLDLLIAGGYSDRPILRAGLSDRPECGIRSLDAEDTIGV